MHRTKTQARNEAWDASGPDGWNKYNPFVRHRYHKRNKKVNRARVQEVEEDRNDNLNHFDAAPAADEHVSTNGEPTGEKGSNGNSDKTLTGSQETAIVRQRKKAGLKGLFHKKDDVETGSEESSIKSNKHKYSFWNQVRYSVFNSWLNVLLIFAPIGIALHFVPTINPVIVFVINFIAIIPLAGTLSYATEEIALRVGETLGGLLNATFGNAVELIVSIIALFKDEIVIVQTSLIGSMLSNLLLVMGMCFFLGGINRKRQHFNTMVAQTAASLLSLAIAALIIPTAFDNYANNTATTSDDASLAQRDAEISRGTSVLLLIVYICYLVFQLRTHGDIYNAPSKKVNKQNLFKSQDAKKKNDASRGLVSGIAGVAGANMHEATRDGMEPTAEEEEDDEIEEQEPTLTWVAAIATLIWSTVLVAICAEFLVDAINDVVSTGGVSRVFIGLILLPIVGNAAEHATALTVACKDKMDLAIGVAVGSSMQIALLVLPLIVIIGWIAGKTDMTLNFDPFDIIILFVAVLLVNYLIADGESHWLEGMMLMTLYLIIALVAWFFPNDVGPGAEPAAER